MNREEWLKELCPELADWQVEAIAEAMDKSVAAEREACAKVCDVEWDNRRGLESGTAFAAAQAIRARGEK